MEIGKYRGIRKMRRRKYYDDYSSSDDEHRRKKTKRGDGTEAARVRKRLANFDSERCIAWIEIQKRFGSGITHSELKSIAQVICEHQREPHLKLDRDASRDNRVLLKWFTENWTIIEPHLKNITLRDSEKRILNGIDLSVE